MLATRHPSLISLKQLRLRAWGLKLEVLLLRELGDRMAKDI
ncbi:MAG: hypothetical protein V7K57_05185 [Nostoc sp.]